MEEFVRRTLLFAIVLTPAISLATTLSATAQIPNFLDQGWSKDVRERFYFTPQSSRMIPYVWFKALEAPDGAGMFADVANLRRYGLIPADEPHPLNPEMLPIGFAI